MGDPFVSDIYPSFKSFHESKTDQGAFTIDNRDIEEIKNRNQVASEATKKSNSNPLAQCDICLVPISSQIVYDTHIKGKKHQTLFTAMRSKNPQYQSPTYAELCSKKQEPVVTTNPNENSETSSPQLPTLPLIVTKKLNCNICNVTCNSQQMYDNHIAGKKHQLKLKSTGSANPIPPRIVPDNNPSSSNYCDVCSLKLNSEEELTEHLAQKRHQTRAKEAEICAKEAVDMNINFDDYKISMINQTDNDKFNYQCVKCNKKFRNKMQLIDHLKSAPHNRLLNPSNNPIPPKTSTRGNRQGGRGGLTRTGGTNRKTQNSTSLTGSKQFKGKSRPYQSQSSSSDQIFDPQTANDIFGAFAPKNQVTNASNTNNNNAYTPTKRPIQYEQIPDEYSGFYPKRTRTYDDNTNNPQNYYTTDGNYYPPASDPYPEQTTTNYNNPTTMSQPPWSYPTDPYYDQQQYTTSDADYMNPMYYPTNQPPLPAYDFSTPPLQNSAYYSGTENQGTQSYYTNSYRH